MKMRKRLLIIMFTGLFLVSGILNVSAKSQAKSYSWIGATDLVELRDVKNHRFQSKSTSKLIANRTQIAQYIEEQNITFVPFDTSYNMSTIKIIIKNRYLYKMFPLVSKAETIHTLGKYLRYGGDGNSSSLKYFLASRNAISYGGGSMPSNAFDVPYAHYNNFRNGGYFYKSFTRLFYKKPSGKWYSRTPIDITYVDGDSEEEKKWVFVYNAKDLAGLEGYRVGIKFYKDKYYITHDVDGHRKIRTWRWNELSVQ